MTTPTFRIEFNDNPFGTSNSIEAWNCKSYGRPSEQNLIRFRKARYESMKSGGCNEHISQARGYIPLIRSAKIIRQKTGEVVTEFTAPMFEVV